MPNHIHIFVFQKENQKAIRELMSAIMTSYSRYYNQKYDRVGPLFQSRYLASRIDSTAYLKHISRYIHLNPKDWRNYPYSSIKYFSGQAVCEWLDTDRVLEILDFRTNEYMDFVADYEDYKESTESIDLELAHQ